MNTQELKDKINSLLVLAQHNGWTLADIEYLFHNAVGEQRAINDFMARGIKQSVHHD